MINPRAWGGSAMCLVWLGFALVTFLSCLKSEPIPSNTLFIGIESGPRMFDPRLSTDAAASKVGDLLFNGLVKRRDDFSIAPDLAESWDTPDRRKYIFHIRAGVVFHNGRKLTSKDVKETFDFILDEKNKSPWRSSLLAIDSMETPDDSTIVFNLKEPSAPFLGSLTVGVTPAGMDTDMAARPIGTGPFRFVDYKTEERLTLARNDGYFDGAPSLAGVVFKIVPDETVRVLELEKGSLHLVMNPITPDILSRLRSKPDLKVVTGLGTNYSYLGFNLEDPIAGNIEVRRAIAYAIDRKSIITYILKGLATPAAGLITKASEYFESELAKYSYDPERAKNILDNAGFTDPDGDGPKVRFTLKYSTSQNELRKRIAEVFQWQLAKVGIGLDIRSYEWGAFYSDIKKGNFQVYSLTWVGIADPDIMHYIFNSESMPPNGANRGRYVNARIDELTRLGRISFGAERKRIYSEAQKILANDLPYISLWHSVNVAVMNRRVKGFVVAPDENLKSIKDVRIIPPKVKT